MFLTSKGKQQQQQMLPLNAVLFSDVGHSPGTKLHSLVLVGDPVYIIDGQAVGFAADETVDPSSDAIISWWKKYGKVEGFSNFHDFNK